MWKNRLKPYDILSPDDVELVHRLWLDCVRAGSPRVHHRDVVAVALRDFEARLEGAERESILARMRNETEAQGRRPA